MFHEIGAVSRSSFCPMFFLATVGKFLLMVESVGYYKGFVLDLLCVEREDVNQ